MSQNMKERGSNRLNIVPEPKKITQKEGRLNALKMSTGSIDERVLKPLRAVLKSVGINISDKKTDGEIKFLRDSSLNEEGYKLSIDENSIVIEFCGIAGAYYAVTTLRQIAVNYGYLQCCEIEDLPDFGIRGLMYDISRNKVPKLKTLKNLVDNISLLKVNHLQLYIEGRPYYYNSFRKLYKRKSDWLTAADIRELDKYCADRFVELVANQNSLGHMAEWLNVPELSGLAENPQGYWAADAWMLPSTLDLTNPKTIDFIDRTYKDLLPNFTSTLFNVNCDEPWELGQGQSQAAVAKSGKGKVYADYINQLDRLARKYGKRLMIWDDVIRSDPAAMALLPKDIIYLEWGYEAEDFSYTKECLYSKAGVGFCVCPGTSAWNSVAGNTDKMLKNISNAALYAKRNNAAGIILTNWGDGAHLQQYAVELYPIAIGVSKAWSAEADNQEAVALYLDRCVFKDESNSLTNLIADMGRYNKFELEPISNMSRLFRLIYINQTDNINLDLNPNDPAGHLHSGALMSQDEYIKTRDYLMGLKARLSSCRLTGKDGKIVLDELNFTLNYLLHAANLGIMKTNNYNRTSADIVNLHKDIAILERKFTNIWKARNKRSNLCRSLFRIKALKNKYKGLLSVTGKHNERSGEKPILR